MNTKEIFGKMLKIKLASEAKADSPTDVHLEEELDKAVWLMGYPTLRQVFTQRIQLPAGVDTHTVAFTYQRLVAGDTFLAADVTHMDVDYIDIDVDREKGINVGWTRKFIEDTNFDAVAVQLGEVGRAVEEEEFSYLIGLLEAADESPGVLTATMGFADFVTGIADLAGADYQADICLLNPTEYFELIQDEEFMNASVIGGETALKDGVIKTTLGVTVFKSTLCTEGTAIFMQTNKAIAVAEIRAKKVEDYAYPDANLYGFVCSHRYGASVILPASVRVLVKSN